MTTSLLLGSLTGTKSVLPGAGNPAAGTNHDPIFQVTGASYLSDLSSISNLSLGFHASSDGFSIDSETGEIRISSQTLVSGITVTMTVSDADEEVSGRFEMHLAIREVASEWPEAPVSAGPLDDVTVSIGSAPVVVDAAANFTGESLTFTVSGAGATIDSGTGLVTIATDGLLKDERITVTASNPGGSATSAFKVTVEPIAPEVLSAPVLTGSGKIGAGVSVEPGVWSGNPAPGIVLQWLLDGAEIAEATGLEYIPAPEDDLRSLSCRVTAANAGGSADAFTEALIVTHEAPELVGILEDVTARKGAAAIQVAAADVFEGSALRFSVDGAGAAIDAGTGVVTIPTDTALSGVEVTVTASNSGGTAEAVFEVSIVSSSVLPVLLGAPALAGMATIGRAVTLDQGLWGGIPAPELAFQWLCDGAEISGATGSEYTPIPADDLKALTCRVTATNVAGSAEAVTEARIVTFAAPVAAGTLPEEVFDQNTGLQLVETAADFTGENLVFAVEGLGAEIDAATGIVSIPTDTALDGGIVTVTASNSGGTATSVFLVTVEAAGPGQPLPLADDEWEIVASVWTPAGQEETYQPKVRIASGIPVHAAQWTTSGYDPALDEHWETLAPVAGQTHEFVTAMLNEGTGDWHLFKEGQARSVNFRLRYKSSEADEWSGESGKKDILPPAAATPPAELANWSALPGTANGTVVISVGESEPASWGSDGSGVIQWWSSGTGWQDVPSPSFTADLGEAMWGLTAEIRVRALGSAGNAGPESSMIVEVPGKQAATTDIWRPALLVGEDALDQGLTNGYREGKGGEHYQFFHGGDVHRLFPDDALTIMDVHHIWYTRNARNEFATWHAPEGAGLTSRFGVTCKFDPEYPGQWVAVCASRTGANPSNVGGLFRTEDHGQTYPYAHKDVYVVGGQGQSNRNFRAWSRTLIWNNQDYNEWLFVNRWYGGQGGETLRSTDRGRTWSVVNTYFKNNQLSRLYTLTQDAKGKVYVGSENGIHSSTDFGGSWSNGTRPSGLPAGWVTGIECHPSNASIAYICVLNRGIYRTTDGFASAHLISPNDTGYWNVFASPYDFSRLWAMSVGKNTSTGGNTGIPSRFCANGLAASPTWTALPRGESKTYGWPQGVGDSTLNVPGKTNFEFMGGVLPLKSSDNKAAILHAKARHWTTTDGINFRNSGDGMEHAGAGDMNADGIAFHPTNPDIACLCAFDKGGLITRNGWKSFYRMGHGAGGVTAAIAGSGTGGFSPDNNRDFVITTGDYNSYSARITHNATADSPSWSTIDPILNDKNGGDAWCRFIKYCPVPGYGNIIYSDHFRSTDNGSSWVDLRGKQNWPSGGYDAHVFWCSYTDHRVLYALNGSMNAVYRSDDRGETWAHYVDLGTSVSLNQGGQKDVAIDVSPLDHDKILWWNQGVGLQEFDGKTKRTMLASERNRSAMWRCKYAFNYPGVFYMHCQDTGSATVWRTSDNGATFTALDKHLPRTGAVRSIVVCPHTDILYTVGTVGTRYFAPPYLNDRAKARLRNYEEWWNYDRSWITATYGY